MAKSAPIGVSSVYSITLPRYAALRTVPVSGDASVRGTSAIASGRIDSATSPSGRPRCGSVSVRPPSATSAVRRVAPREHAAHAVGVAHEAGDERVARLLVELARRAFLRDHRLVHHDDAVGHRHRLGLVVRDVDDGERRGAAAARGSPRASAGAAARRGSTAARRTAAPTARAPARARRATRCCWPPESSDGSRASKPRQADGRQRGARALVGARPCAHARRRRGRSARSRARSCAGTARSSGTPSRRRARRRHARSRRAPPMRMVPAVGSSSPAIMRSDRRLAAAGRAEQRDQRARADRERDVAHGGDVAVALGHARGIRSMRLSCRDCRFTRRCRRARRRARARACRAAAEPALADQPLDRRRSPPSISTISTEL